MAAGLSGGHPVGHVAQVAQMPKMAHVGLLGPIDQAGGDDRAGGRGLTRRILRGAHEDRLQVMVPVGDSTTHSSAEHTKHTY